MEQPPNPQVAAPFTQKNKDPCSICIASGKGGVGKTSIALSLAKEISKTCRVLILDLDYFNRGATGVLADRVRPFRKGNSLLETLLATEPRAPSVGSDTQIEAIDKEPNLLFSGSSGLTTNTLRKLDELQMPIIAQRLQVQFKLLQTELQIGCFIVDAHGGPDPLSFAAASACDFTILVSDPDKVTLYGTLNFVACFQSALAPDAPRPKLKLLFNRVSGAFTWRGLMQIYEENLADLFDGPLLGALPFLPNIFENFASAPFIIDLFPKILFTKKIPLLLRELLLPQWPELLRPEVKAWSDSHIKRLRNATRDTSLARPLPIATMWLLAILSSFGVSLIVSLDPTGTISDILSGVFGMCAAVLSLLASVNSVRLFFQSLATNLRFQTHSLLAPLYKWKLILQVTPLVIGSVIISLFIALLLPALTRAKSRPMRIICQNNLKQIWVAMKTWALDNSDLFPSNTSTNSGGVKELLQLDADGVDSNGFLTFQVLSNELFTPKVLVCPADVITAATSFQTLTRSNVTYFVYPKNGSETNDSDVLCSCPIHHFYLLSDGTIVSNMNIRLEKH